MSRVIVALAAAVGVLLLRADCRRAHSEQATTSAAVASATPQPPPPPRPIVVEPVPITGDLPAFVLRASGAPGAGRPMVFVSGMCAHPVGYVQSFQGAAAARGDLVMVQGDLSCGGDGALRKWSSDLEAMDRRIETAFRASGLGEPRGVTVIGYSQGAERAERLVARWPARYASAVLIASPIVPTPRDLSRSGAVVLMAGTLESQVNMRSAVGPLTRAGIPTRFFELQGSRHGQLGPSPSGPMGQALDFIEESEKVKRPRSAAVTTEPAAR